MQATQIGSMETISAAVPQKVTVAAQSSDSQEGFGSTLHRDMLATHAGSPGTGSGKAETTPGISPPRPTVTKPPTDMDAAKNASEEQVGRVTQSTPNCNVKPAGAPAIFVSPGDVATVPATKVETVPVLPAKGAVAAVPAKKPGSPSEKRIAKTSSLAQSSAASLVAPSTGVQVNISADVLQINARQKPTAEASLGPRTLSTAATPAPPSTKLDKPALAPPIPTGPDGFPSGSAKQESSTALPSKSGHGADSVLAALGTSPAATPANTAVASAIAGNLHAYQGASLNAVAPTPAPIPMALSSARADLQPHAATTLGAAGIGAVHILPSAPTQLDVGVLDGTHGWLRIRAELGAGGVSASLTASPLAHESLNAALPEMAKYLGSEAVSVTKLVVHSFSDGPDKMAFGTEANQQNGSAHERHSGGENALDGGDARRQESSSTDQQKASTATSASNPAALSASVAVASTNQQIPGLANTSPQAQWSFGGLEGISGHWLNVCA